MITRLLTGEVAATDLPGAVIGQRRYPWGLSVETLLARPEGNSMVDRVRRWDHDHPARSIAYLVIMASLAALGYALAAGDGHALSRRPWSIVLSVVATGFAVDAVANTVLFVAVRRRLRRARP